jgi:hypothetical protein
MQEVPIRVNYARAGCANADVRIGDSEVPGLDASFDAAICRLNIMFSGSAVQ